MPARYPRLWLMTDERQGEALWDAVRALPQGSGIIFRHYSLLPGARQAMFKRLRAITRARRLVLILAGSPRLARAWRADGFHGRDPGQAFPELLHTAPAHDAAEIIAAMRSGAGLAMLSPIYPTRSHPGARTLGALRFGLIARRRPRIKIVALGGMNAARAQSVKMLGAYGWSGIDGLTPAGRFRI